jgi:hypothetical protein
MEHETCTHHWRIEPPEDAESEGTCLRCGASRQFRNSLVPRQWGEFAAVERARVRPALAGSR